MDALTLKPGRQKLLTLPQFLMLNPGTLAEDFENAADWTPVSSPAGGTLADDAFNKKIGANSLKLTTPAAAGYIQATKTVSFKSDGNLRFWMYVPGAAPSNVNFLAGNEPSAWTNYFSTGLNVGGFRLRNTPGWNLISLRTADWSTGGGAPSWNNPIRQLRIKVSTAGAATVVNLDGLYVGQKVQPALALTFDDGLDSQYFEAFTFLRKHRVRASLYAVSDWQTLGTGYTTWAQLQEMYAAGWTIANHTRDHADLTTLSQAQQEAEMADCEAALQAHGITDRTRHLAFPSGASNANTLLALAAQNMLSARHVLHWNINSQVGWWYWLPASLEPDPSTSLATATAWIDTTITRQELAIACVHGLSGSPTGSNWYTDRFQAFITYCIAKGVPILTLDDLYRLQSRPVTIPRAV